jgi:hypothetical protein
MRSSNLLKLVACVACIASLAPAAFAGGPLIIYDLFTRTPYSYPGPINVYTDLGGMGPLTNAQADGLTSTGYAEWTNVASSTLTAAVAGDFGTVGLPDIVGANTILVVGTFNGGGIHVMYDHDGSIIAGFFGAPPGVLGIGSPDFSDGTQNLVESWCVVNGTAVDIGDVGGASFAGVFTHEFGHTINLAHTQTNGAVGFFGDPDVPGGCPPAGYSGGLTFNDFETMYPFIDPSPGSVGIQMATINVLDDIASVSNVYPAAGWPASFGTITGIVYRPDAVTQVTGVNVIARNLAKPFEGAISAVSGDYTQGDLGPDGLFTLNGLAPGASYVLYVDDIVAGGFSTPPATLPGPEEYWNATESNLDATDNVCDVTAIVTPAGSPVTADVIFNGDPNDLGLSDDDFVQVPLPFTFPFCATDYNSVFVGSNGFLTFGSGDTDFTESVAELLAFEPRIAPWWDDLNPAAGGTITALPDGADFLVSWNNVPEFAVANSNSFSVRLRSDGSYTVEYGNVDAVDGIAGRSEGNGAANPGETDLSTATQPLGQGMFTVYELFTGDGDLDNLGLDFAPCQLAPPPQIVVTPNSLSETLQVDEQSVQQLTIENIGGQTLDFVVLHSQPAPAPAPGRGNDPPREWLSKAGAAHGGVIQEPELVHGTPPVLSGERLAKSQRDVAATKAARGRIAKAGPPFAQLPHTYANTHLDEDFNAGFPAGWTTIDNEGGSVIWTLNPADGEGNYTGASGTCASASSDNFGPAEFDTEMWTPTISGFGTNVVLSYVSNYQNFAFLDFLDVDISTDGGTTWTTVLSWNEDHPVGGLFAPPGVAVVLPLDGFLGGATEFIVRWHYYDPNSGDFDWYAQVDDVLIVSDEIIAPCPWLSLSPGAGNIQPGGPPVDIDVAFDATGLAPGTYNCEILVNSNDPVNGQVVVPVELTVVEDVEPPVIVVAPPSECWPPNHKYTTLNIADFVVSVTDEFAGPIPVSAVNVTYVTSDEPENGPGSGNTLNDIIIAPDCKSVQLRCERSGDGDGRVYTIHVAVADPSGNVATAAYLMNVPLGMDGIAAVDGGPMYTVVSSCGASPKMAQGPNAGNGQPGSGDVTTAAVPKQVALFQNVPNPFNPSTTIAFALPSDTHTSLRVFDASGRWVRTLVSRDLGPGEHRVHWDGLDSSGRSVPTGIYVYELSAGSERFTKKMLLIK